MPACELVLSYMFLSIKQEVRSSYMHVLANLAGIALLKSPF